MGGEGAKEVSVVYFMRLARTKWIKIGCTIDLEGRKRQLERHYARKLFLLGTIPGDPDDERWVHDKFAHLRAKKGRKGGALELFLSAPDLLEFIANKGPILTKVARFELACRFDVDCLDPVLSEFARFSAREQGIPIADYIQEKVISYGLRNWDFKKMISREIARERNMRQGLVVDEQGKDYPLFGLFKGETKAKGEES